MRPATEAAIGRAKAHPASKREDGGVVVTSVVKDKVTNCMFVYTKLLQQLANNLSNFLSAVGAGQLR
jgi:hypothetical protein